MRKKISILLASSVFAALFTITAHAAYPLNDVIDACENAYSRGDQVAACIRNICNHYGCR